MQICKALFRKARGWWLGNGDFEDGVAEKKFRFVGGGRKARALEVTEALFQWFVDAIPALKGDCRRFFFFYKLRSFM